METHCVSEKGIPRASMLPEHIDQPNALQPFDRGGSLWTACMCVAFCGLTCGMATVEAAVDLGDCALEV